ncbi:MAG TPA: M23 family metallopeptidase [Bacteroidia bacterium]|nr:M23 family metallopeptidase [Bacteroidia bacterium]
MFLTGNYGEIRPNHFHAGLDFKTDPVKHLPIYAVANGYVSRIKVGTHGYGKVLYITHTNGKVSVYGHQYSFNDSIKKYVQAAQNMFESFEVELFPQIDEIKVRQGEIIGYTGNTGDTEGPHLHFEIRDEKSEVPLNPMRFLQIMDTVAPTIVSVGFYEADYTKPQIFKAKKNKTDTVTVRMDMGIGVECFDLEQKPGNKNNVYAIELVLDGTVYHRQVLDSIPFDMARYVNTYYDYDLKWQKKIVLQKCFKGKNNDLSIYKNGHSGFLIIDDTVYHNLKIKVYDYFKNSAEVNFVVKRIAATKMKPLEVLSYNCLKSFKSENENYKIEIPEKSLYTDTYLESNFYDNALHLYAKGYDVPFQKSCTLGIKPNPELVKYADKLCIAEKKAYCGGNYKDGFVTTTVKNFGTYKVGLDTIAPAIKFIKPKTKKVYKAGDVISFKVSDEFSGIGNFKIFVNDKFQLAEYEHKTGMIFFEVNDKTPKGKIIVRLELSDKKNNKTIYTQSLTFE